MVEEQLYFASSLQQAIKHHFATVQKAHIDVVVLFINICTVIRSFCVHGFQVITFPQIPRNPRRNVHLLRSTNVENEGLHYLSIRTVL